MSFIILYIVYVILDDPVSIRKRVFSILDGRIFTKDEFIEFFLSIYKLHKIGCERFKINHGNMTEKEKKTIRILFSCNQHQFLTTINVDSTSWIEMAESSNAVLISEGISEYRRDVLPEFLRVFKEGEAIADEQNRHAFLLEESLLIFGVTRSNISNYFCARIDHFDEIIAPEYIYLQD